MESPPTNFQAAFEIGLAQDPITIDNYPFHVVPDGCTIHDFEHVFANPRRASGIVTLHDSESLIDYVNRHKTESTLASAGSTSGGWFVDVCLNHHTNELPGWKDHRAVFRPPVSRQWQEWIDIDRKPMNQQDFADFIEDHLTDIYSPDAADLLSMCLTFTRSAKSEFTQNRRLEDGSYSVTVSDEGKAEGMNVAGQKVIVPDQLGLMLPVFQHESDDFGLGDGSGNAAMIRARLRTRVADGKLTFTIRLQDADETLENARHLLVKKISAETNVKVYRGSAL